MVFTGSEVGIGVGVGVTIGPGSQIIITDPALPPLPFMVKEVKGNELFTINCPAPQVLPQIGSQSLFILLAVITLPEIDAQHPLHKAISGVLFPVSVVNVKVSEGDIPYPSKIIVIKLTG